MPIPQTGPYLCPSPLPRSFSPIPPVQAPPPPSCILQTLPTLPSQPVFQPTHTQTQPLAPQPMAHLLNVVNELAHEVAQHPGWQQVEQGSEGHAAQQESHVRGCQVSCRRNERTLDMGYTGLTPPQRSWPRSLALVFVGVTSRTAPEVPLFLHSPLLHFKCPPHTPAQASQPLEQLQWAPLSPDWAGRA